MQQQIAADGSRQKSAKFPAIQDHASYLFIAGAPRCGTTTLFDYLSRHPETVASRVKEPGFLIPREFPMKGFRHLYLEDGLQDFQALFADRAGLRMEASATYLYAPYVAERLQKHFPNAKVLLILRDPIKRFISEYRFSMMMRVIPHNMTFSDYLTLQRRQPDNDRWKQPELRALSNGLYSRFIKEFIEQLGRDRLYVCWTEKLQKQPEKTMQNICRFARIDPHHFTAFEGSARNASRQITRPLLYALLFRAEAWRANRIAKGRHGLITRLLGRLLITPSLRIATANAKPIAIKPDEQAFLKEYYAGEPEQLKVLLGERPPW